MVASVSGAVSLGSPCTTICMACVARTVLRCDVPCWPAPCCATTGHTTSYHAVPCRATPCSATLRHDAARFAGFANYAVCGVPHLPPPAWVDPPAASCARFWGFPRAQPWRLVSKVCRRVTSLQLFVAQAQRAEAWGRDGEILLHATGALCPAEACTRMAWTGVHNPLQFHRIYCSPSLCHLVILLHHEFYVGHETHPYLLLSTPLSLPGAPASHVAPKIGDRQTAIMRSATRAGAQARRPGSIVAQATDFSTKTDQSLWKVSKRMVAATAVDATPPLLPPQHHLHPLIHYRHHHHHPPTLPSRTLTRSSRQHPNRPSTTPRWTKCPWHWTTTVQRRQWLGRR